MKISRPLLSVILSLTFLMSSCQEDSVEPATENTKSENKRIEKASALLIWSGSYASDGCGFTLEIDGKTYFPENETEINDTFNHKPATPFTPHVTPIEVEFQKTDTKINRPCGYSADSRIMDGIRILSITKK